MASESPQRTDNPTVGRRKPLPKAPEPCLLCCIVDRVGDKTHQQLGEVMNPLERSGALDPTRHYSAATGRQGSEMCLRTDHRARVIIQLVVCVALLLLGGLAALLKDTDRVSYYFQTGWWPPFNLASAWLVVGMVWVTIGGVWEVRRPASLSPMPLGTCR